MSAEAEDLSTLRAEAARRGEPLAALLGEAVAEKAAGLRAARKPRLGIAGSEDGRSARELTAEPVAHPPS